MFGQEECLNTVRLIVRRDKCVDVVESAQLEIHKTGESKRWQRRSYCLNVSMNGDCFAYEFFDIALWVSIRFAIVIEMIDTTLTNDTQCWRIENAQFIT